MSMLETDRLRLRPFQLEDAQAVRELAGDYEIAKTTLNIPHPYPEGAAEEWILSQSTAVATGTGRHFAIVLKANDMYIGSMGLGIHRTHQRAEIAYFIGRPYWGKGYATEAAQQVLRYGFTELGLHRIFAFAFTDNPASTRVMEKIGMTYEGTLVGHVCKWGEMKDLAAYGIIASDWRSFAPTNQ